LDREEIWHDELVAGAGPFARHLLPERPNKNYNSRLQLVDMLRQKAISGDVSKEWAASEQMRKDAGVKRNNQRAIAAEIRQTVSTALRERRVTGSTREFPFSKFKKRDLIRTGRQLMDLVDKERQGSVVALWVQNPARYPFYSAFVEGFLYAGYYAAAEHNHPLDRNAQADYELLAYLTWADLVVSNDRGFFQRAFETIWKPRGKRLESAETFADLLGRLA
jgi:hypothetical protein